MKNDNVSRFFTFNVPSFLNEFKIRLAGTFTLPELEDAHKKLNYCISRDYQAAFYYKLKLLKKYPHEQPQISVNKEYEFLEDEAKRQEEQVVCGLLLIDALDQFLNENSPAHLNLREPWIVDHLIKVILNFFTRDNDPRILSDIAGKFIAIFKSTFIENKISPIVLLGHTYILLNELTTKCDNILRGDLSTFVLNEHQADFLEFNFHTPYFRRQEAPGSSC